MVCHFLIPLAGDFPKEFLATQPIKSREEKFVKFVYQHS